MYLLFLGGLIILCGLLQLKSVYFVILLIYFSVYILFCFDISFTIIFYSFISSLSSFYLLISAKGAQSCEPSLRTAFFQKKSISIYGNLSRSKLQGINTGYGLFLSLTLKQTGILFSFLIFGVGCWQRNISSTVPSQPLAVLECSPLECSFLDIAGIQMPNQRCPHYKWQILCIYIIEQQEPTNRTIETSHIFQNQKHIILNSLLNKQYTFITSFITLQDSLKIHYIVVDYNMSKIQVIKNTFSSSTLKQLLKCLEFINWEESADLIAKQIQEVSPKGYLWAVAINPAYFVQYQVNSAAILKVKSHGIIVWKPKFIEYPSMIVFPQLKQKKINSMNVEILNGFTTTENTNKHYIQFIQKFYGTYFHSDKDFQTNLVTYSKHFISKISQHSYWHAIMQDTGKLKVTNEAQMDSVLRVRIHGLKEGYDKTIFLFSYKGSRENIFVMLTSKWMQLLSFIGMVIIFYAMVACNGEDPQGLCVYKQEMTIGGAGIMLALLGIRFANKNKNKKRMRPIASNNDKTE